MYSKIIIASGPVIVENKKVLLDISGNNNFWKFCGGKIKENETLQETAIRRSKEELGIKIKIINEKPFFWHTKKTINNEVVDIILVHYLAEKIGKIKPGDDIYKWKWILLEKLHKENLAPNIIPALKYFSFTEN